MTTTKQADPFDPSTWKTTTRELPARQFPSRQGSESKYADIIKSAHESKAVIELPYAMDEPTAKRLQSSLRAAASALELSITFRADTERNDKTQGKRPEGHLFYLWAVAGPLQRRPKKSDSDTPTAA